METKKIRFLEADQISTGAWDQLVFDAPNGMIYAYSWYLDMIAPNWGAMVFGDYEAILPLVYNKKYGVSYVFPPNWAQQLGVISKEKTSKELAEQMLSAIPARFKYVSLHLNSANPKIEHFKSVMNRNLELPLNHTYDELYASYSSQTKRNLKKAKKHELHYFENDKPEFLIELFKSNKGREISQLKDQHYFDLKHIMYACIHKGVGKVCSVYGERNELLASAFFLSYFGRSVFLFSGLSSYGKETGAMTYLIDNYLKPFAGQDHILDFEGSNNDNLARFYAGFGAEEFHYQTITINRLPWPVKYLKA